MRLMHDPRLREARFGLCLLGALSLSLLAGCGGGGGGSNGNSGTGTTTTGVGTSGATNSTTGTNTGGSSSLTVTAKTSSGLTASISEPSATVAVGGSVTYTMTLTNNTATAIPVHSNNSGMAAAGLIVRNSSGSITYAPLPPTVPFANGSLAPGQSLTETLTATGFTVPGVYLATATFSDEIGPNQSAGPLTVTAQ